MRSCSSRRTRIRNHSSARRLQSELERWERCVLTDLPRSDLIDGLADLDGVARRLGAAQEYRCRSGIVGAGIGPTAPAFA